MKIHSRVVSIASLIDIGPGLGVYWESPRTTRRWFTPRRLAGHIAATWCTTVGMKYPWLSFGMLWSVILREDRQSIKSWSDGKRSDFYSTKRASWDIAVYRDSPHRNYVWRYSFYITRCLFNMILHIDGLLKDYGNFIAGVTAVLH